MFNIKIQLKTLFPDIEVYFDVNIQTMTTTCSALELPESAAILTFGKCEYEMLKIEFDYFPIRIKYFYINRNIVGSDYSDLIPYVGSFIPFPSSNDEGTLERYMFLFNMHCCKTIDYNTYPILKLESIYLMLLHIRKHLNKHHIRANDYMIILEKLLNHLPDMGLGATFNRKMYPNVQYRSAQMIYQSRQLIISLKRYFNNLNIKI